MIAGTDCGLGGRIHPQLAWAKLRALSAGAALASRQLWGRTVQVQQEPPGAPAVIGPD